MVTPVRGRRAGRAGRSRRCGRATACSCKTGEVVPVDGVLMDAGRLRRDRALTGESRPSSGRPGEQVRSGAVNAGPAFDLRAIATAAESTYAGHRPAGRTRRERQKAPFVRLADRYALIFIPRHARGRRRAPGCVLGRPGARAGRAGGGDAVPADPGGADRDRGRASRRAARRGIIVKGGGALETLGRAAGAAVRQDRHAHRGGARRSPTSRCSTGSTPTSCCGSPPRSTRSRRTCWRRRSCGAARERGLDAGVPDRRRWRSTVPGSRARSTAGTSRSARRRSSPEARRCRGAPGDVRRRTALDGASLRVRRRRRRASPARSSSTTRSVRTRRA